MQIFIKISSYIALSAFIVFFSKYIKGCIDILLWMQTVLAKLVTLPNLEFKIQLVILLVLMPIVITTLVSLIFKWITKRSMPYFLTIVWTLWLILSISHLLIS